MFFAAITSAWAALLCLKVLPEPRLLVGSLVRGALKTALKVVFCWQDVHT